jgi:asparagine synthase (glutamine-hydrolysing)
MCGIAGIVDLTGGHPVPIARLRRMNDALIHRGPDAQGLFEQPRVALASRRLAILGLADGNQPVANEDGTVHVVFNGELFDYPDVKRRLQSAGHRLTTGCDTELIPHLYEERQEAMLADLRGQFAIAVWSARHQRLVLARDRFGIIPLYWSRQRRDGADWLLFASEIKALLASGLVEAAPDLRGIDQVFHFLAVPGPSTCFAGVKQLQPGHYLTVDLGSTDAPATIRDHVFWDLDFPPADDGRGTDDRQQLVDRFDEVMLGAVERRLRADVPVVSYLSGGVDSSVVVAMAAKLRGTAIPAFTVQIASPRFDETAYAATVADHVGARPTVLRVDDATIQNAYPALIAATEAPVVDTSSAASMLLAEEVHRAGYKVALAGEGSDEWLGGYLWHKMHKVLALTGVSGSEGIRRIIGSVVGAPRDAMDRILSARRTLGHYSAFHDLYGLMTAARYLLLDRSTLDALRDHDPYLELQPDLPRLRGWHPLHQSAYWAAKIHLPGHLLSLKGDRIAMRSSVETRYPFLDEEVFAFLAGVHPRWKLRGLRDKYLLRLVAERYLPKPIAWRRKVMFRAPMHSFFVASAPYVDQLLSEESLRRTGWFDAAAVRGWRDRIRRGGVGFHQRTIIELGMVAVVASQLWYHTFIDGSLADLPGASAASRRQRPRDAMLTT